MLHELIDSDNPKCLYCNSEVDIKLDGEEYAMYGYEYEILTCRSCNSVFEIVSKEDPGLNKIYTGFQFTCNDIGVYYSYQKNYFLLGDVHILHSKRPAPATEYVTVPYFDIDFSDKKKLYKKLKTYVTFS